MKIYGASFTEKTKLSYWYIRLAIRTLERNFFYPAELKYSDWLYYYSKYFSTVEINVTFYRDVRTSTFQKWYNSTPKNFLFSVKLSRQITHFKRLKVDKLYIESFIQKYSTLKEKLGVILIQLPPGLKFDETLVDDFISMLDKTYKYTIEVRNKTFIHDKFFLKF